MKDISRATGPPPPPVKRRRRYIIRIVHGDTMVILARRAWLTAAILRAEEEVFAPGPMPGVRGGAPRPLRIATGQILWHRAHGTGRIEIVHDETPEEETPNAG